MLKNINTYYLGFCFLIVLLQLIIPPKLEDTYSYLLFLIGVFIVNGGYRYMMLLWKSSSKHICGIPFKYFERSDFELLTFLLNIIAVSTFFYFFYMHVTVMAGAVESPSGLKVEEYIYREKSYFMTKDEYYALNFWEFSTFMLIPFSLLVGIIGGYINRKFLKNSTLTK